MILTTAARTALLNHLLANADWANIGDATGLRGSTVAGSLYMSLHTADPGDAGSQTTSESAYGAYARQTIARSGAGWTVAAGAAENAALITFPQCTSGSETLLHWGLGTALSGAGNLLMKGPLIVSGANFFAATCTVADVFTVPGHNFILDDRIVFYQAGGIALPTGITEGTVYWVLTVTGDTFSVSTTQGGGAVNVTVAGAALAIKAQPIAVSAPIRPEVAIGALDLAFH